MSGISQRKVEVRLDGRCQLACVTCDCHASPLGRTELERAIAPGGSRLTLRNGDGASMLEPAVLLGLGAGFTDIALRTSGVGLVDAAAAQHLRRLGIGRVVVPFFSARSAVHDRLTRREGSLSRALVGFRAAATAGLAVAAEVPLLADELQDLDELVRLLARAVPKVAGVRFFAPDVDLPASIAAPDWSRGGPRLARAIELCLDSGIEVVLGPRDGVPFCALAKPEGISERVFRFSPNGAGGGVTTAEPCSGCAMKRQCPGVTLAHAKLNPGHDLVPFTRRHKGLFGAQRTSPPRRWTETTRTAASRVGLRVLRPTVNCNQDCVFCSANETSGNVWEDPDEMLRVIARAARTGIYQLSFGGGEPTLSKHLVDFVKTASRLGIREVELVTNAVLLAQPAKAQALRAAGLTAAFVSLHAHDEELSRRITLKNGDFQKTVLGIKHLVESGVTVRVNHVISSLNYRYLERFVSFVASEFDNRVSVSFAFVTPQYRALENFEVVPKLSSVMPYLARAMYRALELGVKFVVGSRQGIPPCFLREFAPWSDVFSLSAEAAVEDVHQKQKAEACERCRYSGLCTGLWKPYVARFGLAEIEPAVGPKLEIRDVFKKEGRKESPLRFEEAPPLLRDPARESLGLEGWPLVDETLGELVGVRSRPVRALLSGSGQRAKELFSAAQHVTSLTLDAVASPHAPEGDARRFGFRPTYASVAEAIRDVEPECVVIAAGTAAHESLLRLALEAGLHVLVEKPVGGSAAPLAELSGLASERKLIAMPAHQVLYAAGMERLLERAPFSAVRCVRRVAKGSPDLPASWNRKALFEVLYHLSVLINALARGEVSGVGVQAASNAAQPEHLRLLIEFEGTRAELLLESTAGEDELSLSGDAVGWSRRAGRVRVTEPERSEDVRGSMSDTAAMLDDFGRLLVSGDRPGRPGLSDAARAIALTERMLTAIEAHGISFARPGAPRHASTRGLGPSYG